MPGEIILPPGVALGIIAFLLALLPSTLMIWMWYLRRHDRPIPGRAVALAFGAGMVLVFPAFQLESFAGRYWQAISPATAHNFIGAVLPLQSLWDVLLPAIGTFFIVAAVEEGLRYLLLRVWIARSNVIDQVFDGLLVGLAAGLGFATLENAIYFLDLFQQGSYDTLVFVFFLRFLISTLAHISFGGLMGALIARGVFHIYRPGGYYWQAFLLPWFLHGLYDLLLGIDQSLYAVFLLLPALIVLALWTTRREFYIINRKNGHLLAVQQPPATKQRETVKKFLARFDSPWNTHAPWLNERLGQRTLLHQLKEYES